MLEKKTYQIRLLDKDLIEIGVLDPRTLMSDIQFSSSVNWGQWELHLDINQPYNSTIFDEVFMIKVYVTDSRNDDFLLYTGIVTKIFRNIVAWKKTISLLCLWLGYLLSRIYYIEWTYKHTQNQEPALTIQAIIDDVNDYYPLFSIPWGNVPYYWTDMSIEFDKDYCSDALAKISNAIQRIYYINQEWELSMKPKPSGNIHTMTLGTHIESINIEEDREDISNRVYAVWTFETTPRPWVTQENESITAPFDNAWSSNIYWRAQKILDTWLRDENTAELSAQDYLNTNKDPKRAIRVVVNNNYHIESINPWDTVKIENCDLGIDNLQVYKVTYSQHRVILEFEKIKNIWQFIS